MIKKIRISHIVNCITSTTGMNFQVVFITVLEIICKYKNLKLERIQPTNGDAKNDGWIPSKNIYFAMHSPNDPKISQLNAINKKLSSDLDGLCEHVYENEEWGREISEFYLIVNTHDQDLPADPKRLMSTTISRVLNKYNKKFKAEVIPAKEIKHFLIDSDDELVEKIANYLDLYIEQPDFLVSDIINFVDEYVSYLTIQKIELSKTDYSRIDIEKKIDINGLGKKKERILELIDASDKIDKYLEFINSEGMDFSKYEKIKNYVIKKYLQLSNEYSGQCLYEKLLDELVCDIALDSKALILEAIVVNIFIKCDIFSKE